MKILHVLDHSIPLHSGYTFRTKAILEQQKSFGWETFHLTGSKQGHVSQLKEEVDGLIFYRTSPASGLLAKLPVLNQWAVIKGLEKRLFEVVEEVKPDIIHAHSPALNGKAAVTVGKKLNLPVVYEIRAFWEDAAVSHGTSTPNGLRYNLTRKLETSVVQQANAVTVICHGLKQDLIARGIPEQKITSIPNAVDLTHFAEGEKDEALAQTLGLTGHVVFGFIGSFYDYEGLPILLDALPKIQLFR